jgi:hypothetical protein
VLVLRTRPAGYRKPAVMDVSELLALRDDPRLLELLRERHGNYNHQAAALEHGLTGDGQAQVLQVAVPDGTRLIGRLQADPGRVIEALRLGAKAMASLLLTDMVDLCWQPVVYGAALAEPSIEPLRAPTPRWRSAIMRAGARVGSPAS